MRATCKKELCFLPVDIVDALGLIGIFKSDKPLPDIQEIKANRYDV